MAKSRGPRRRYSSSRRPAAGSLILSFSFSGAFMALVRRLGLELGHVDPAPLLPAAQRAVDELQALGALDEIPAERGAFADVPDEELPFGLERVLAGGRVRNFVPVCEEIVALRHVGVPHRPGRGVEGLREAAREPRDRGAARAVDLERGEIVAAHADRPRAVDLRDHAAVELEG